MNIFLVKKFVYTVFIALLLLQPFGLFVASFSLEHSSVQNTFSVDAATSKEEALGIRKEAERKKAQIEGWLEKAYLAKIVAEERDNADLVATFERAEDELGTQVARAQRNLEEGDADLEAGRYEEALEWYDDVYTDGYLTSSPYFTARAYMGWTLLRVGFDGPYSGLDRIIEVYDINIGNTDEKARELAKARTDDANKNGALGCFDSITTPNLGACLEDAVSWLGYIVLTVAGWLVTVSAMLLNTVAAYTIFNLKGSLENLSTIETAWTIIRDLANLSLIFILLYIAIGTILQLEKVNTGKAVLRVVIVAVLINFSMFFTEVIIDAGNIFATMFYNLLNEIGGKDGISGAITQITGVTGLFDAGTYAESAGVDGDVLFSQLIFRIVGGVIVMSIFAFVLFAISFILFARFIILIFLLITSAGAFALSILPQTNQYSSRWWSALINQTFIAPLLFLFVWIVVTMLNTDTLITTNNNSGALVNSLTNPEDGVDTLLKYGVAIALLVASLVVSAQLGIGSAKTATKWGKTLNKKVGTGLAKRTAGSARRAGGASLRGTAGRMSLAADNALAKTKFGSGKIGRNLRSVTTGKVADAKFGTKIDAKKASKNRDENRTNLARATQRKQELRREKIENVVQKDTDVQTAKQNLTNIKEGPLKTTTETLRNKEAATRRTLGPTKNPADKRAQNDLVKQATTQDRQARATELKQVRLAQQEVQKAEDLVRNPILNETRLGRKLTKYDEKQNKDSSQLSKLRKEAKEYAALYKQERKKKENANKSVKEIFDTLAKQDRDKKKKERLLADAVKDQEKQDKKDSGEKKEDPKPSTT